MTNMNPIALFQSVTRSTKSRSNHSSHSHSHSRSRGRSTSGPTSRGRSRASSITTTTMAIATESYPVSSAPTSHQNPRVTSSRSPFTLPPLTIPFARQGSAADIDSESETESGAVDRSSPVSPLSPYSTRSRTSSCDEQTNALSSSMMKMTTTSATGSNRNNSTDTIMMDMEMENMMPIITVTNCHGKTSTHTCFYLDEHRNRGGDFDMICQGCEESD
jgi:hypothetical protein